MNTHTRITPETEAERAERLAEEAREEAREWALEQFHEWQREGIRGLHECDDNPREYEQFSPWLIRMAQPHMVDCERYQEALDWSERAVIELDRIAKGHRAFVRQERG